MKNIYFASDFHLGYPSNEESTEREKRIVAWLDSIKPTCKELYLLGDVFDFWYEYKWVVPKGYVRFLAKLAEFTDVGIPVYMFEGNHDQWLFGYLQQECGVTICKTMLEREWAGKRFVLHHGHALGHYDTGMNVLHWVFTRKFLQKLFSLIHPSLSFSLAHAWSKKNRKAKEYESSHYLGDDKEYLLQYSLAELKKRKVDYFIFGHRHVPLNKELPGGARYINVGNWITHSTYAYFDGNDVILTEFS
ncbi:MAG: UDP-2,3-diacylglucosamine diphosphatase [Bacteroidales bacterium]|nr:UDP-2,3-diacylglucosamine diphosphatase [Bacteroidales bacterium]